MTYAGGKRARIAILSRLFQFGLGHRHDDHAVPASVDWSFNSNSRAKPGDLVVLQSAPISKWYLSWVVETKWPQGNYGEIYTLASIEDGELCNWSNVTVKVFNRQTTSEHPEWKWSDQQYAFNDKWMGACYKKRDAYMYLPTQAVFEGAAVTLGLRVRFGMSEDGPSKWFPSWKRLKTSEMLDWYDEAVESIRKAKKEPEQPA